MAGNGKGPLGRLLRIPMWQGNLLTFGLLVLLVLAVVLFQIGSARRAFVEEATSHARLAADIIRLHARDAVLSGEVIQEILHTFLGNTARFVEYLDTVEPFQPEELSAFARESGLAGIRIVRGDGSTTEGPAGWGLSRFTDCGRAEGIIHDASRHLILLTVPSEKKGGCIFAGIRAVRIERLQKEIGLTQALNSVSRLRGMLYVRLEKMEMLDGDALLGTDAESGFVKVRILEEEGGAAAEVSLPLGGARLVVGLDALALKQRIGGLWRFFIIVSAALTLSGILLSWLLYRHQLFHLSEVQEYERRLSHQREEAVLGRSAAAIAHEVRNPLNAMAMGLQRLQMEAEELSGNHQKLISAALDALHRTNGIVTGLLNFARPLHPDPKPVNLDALLEEVLVLYQQAAEKSGVKIYKDFACDGRVRVDPDLMAQVASNLVKNALEAQPEGGVMHLGLHRQGDDVLLTVRNGGAVPDPDEMEGIFEPYVTTKTRGTGLGLPISRRIVQAHGGEIKAVIVEKSIMEVRIVLHGCGGNSCRDEDIDRR